MDEKAEVARRLKIALEAWRPDGRYVLPFTEAMKNTDWAAGRRTDLSRATVQRYLSGETLPPLDFLKAAAALLGTRPAWLILLDDGEMTEMEDAVRRASAPPSPAEAYAAQLERLLSEMIVGYDELPAWSRATVWEVLNRYLRSARAIDAEDPEDPGEADDGHPDPTGYAADAVEAIANSVTAALAAATTALRGEQVPRDALAAYVAGACQAMLHLIPSPSERVALEKGSHHAEA